MGEGVKSFAPCLCRLLVPEVVVALVAYEEEGKERDGRHA
jgi:hypothetical protein